MHGGNRLARASNNRSDLGPKANNKKEREREKLQEKPDFSGKEQRKYIYISRIDIELVNTRRVSFLQVETTFFVRREGKGKVMGPRLNSNGRHNSAEHTRRLSYYLSS